MNFSKLHVWDFWKNSSFDGVKIPKFLPFRLGILKVGQKIVPKIRVMEKKLWERNSTSNLTFRMPHVQYVYILSILLKEVAFFSASQCKFLHALEDLAKIFPERSGM